MVKGKSNGELVEEVKAYKHLLSGKVFSSLEECKGWATKWEKEVVQRKEIEARKCLLSTKLNEIDREILKEVIKKKKHEKDGIEYVKNHTAVRNVEGLIDTNSLQIKKLELAVKLLKASLKNQKISALVEYNKSTPFDSKPLKNLRSKHNKTWNELNYALRT